MVVLALAALAVSACSPEPVEDPPPPSVSETGASSIRWEHRPGDTFDYLLGGTAADALASGASVVVIDGADTTAEEVRTLHEAGTRVVCYVNGGAWEPYRADEDAFPDDLVGRPVEGWPDERWLDIRRVDALIDRMDPRVADCATKDFDGIEFDNVDAFTHETGFPLTPQHQKDYNGALAELAHRHGLPAALKNDVDQLPSMVSRFDFAINEQCVQYEECALYATFIEAGKTVYNIEYTEDPNRCVIAEQLGMLSILKELELGPGRTDCP